MWLHRQGHLHLSLPQLLTYRHRLSQHHSRDPHHLWTVKQTIRKQVAAMSEESNSPWRCGRCKRLIKAMTAFCPACGGHWTTVQDIHYKHGQPSQNKSTPQAGWEWEQWSEWDQDSAKGSKGGQRRARSPRQRSQSQRRRQSQKGKSKGKAEDLNSPAAAAFPSLPASPFAAQPTYVAPTPTAPWSLEKTMEQPSANQELITAVRKAYPDPAGMPSELKDILDQTENSEMKRITSDLHKSTAALGRATRQLQELQESKAQHRAKWLQHLTSSMEAWQSQMESYDKQQHQFNTMIQQATTELHTARKSIQQLNAKAAKDKHLETLPEESTTSMPSALESAQDVEEKKMRAKMQELIASTAKLATPLDTEVIPVDDASPTAGVKRQRSSERVQEGTS